MSKASNPKSGNLVEYQKMNQVIASKKDDIPLSEILLSEIPLSEREETKHLWIVQSGTITPIPRP